jgi:hypothetical protein
MEFKCVRLVASVGNLTLITTGKYGHRLEFSIKEVL